MFRRISPQCSFTQVNAPLVHISSKSYPSTRLAVLSIARTAGRSLTEDNMPSA